MDHDTKANRLFNEVQNEMKNDFSKMKDVEEAFRNKYFSVLGKLDDMFRSKCKEPISWLEANTENTQQGPKLKDQSKMKELEKNVNDLQTCIQKQDSAGGINSQQLLSNFDTSMNEMGWKFNSKFEECVKLTADDSMKSCFSELLKDQIKERNNFYATFTKEFDALNSKL